MEIMRVRRVERLWVVVGRVGRVCGIALVDVTRLAGSGEAKGLSLQLVFEPNFDGSWVLEGEISVDGEGDLTSNGQKRDLCLGQAAASRNCERAVCKTWSRST